MPFAGTLADAQLLGNFFVGIALAGIQHKHGMGGRGQAADMEQDGFGVHFFYHLVVNKRFLHRFQLLRTKPGLLLQVIQCFVYHNAVQPSRNAALATIIVFYAAEHFYKSMAEDIASAVGIFGIAQGNAQGNRVQLPVQLLLCPPLLLSATFNQMVNVLLQYWLFYPFISCMRRSKMAEAKALNSIRSLGSNSLCSHTFLPKASTMHTNPPSHFSS